MGICASCLGQRRKSSTEPSEAEGLLYDDALAQSQYGTVAGGRGAPHVPEPDPEELRREREELERICAETSSDLIDVLNHSTTAPNSKIASELPHLLNKHFSKTTRHTSGSSGSQITNGDNTNGTADGEGEVEAEDEDEGEEEDEQAWLSSAHVLESRDWEEVKGLKPGGLVIKLTDSTGQISGKKSMKRRA